MNPHIESLCDRFCSSIMEHADSVRVFVTYREGGDTHEFTEGDGNDLAQERQVQKFLIHQNHITMERIKNGGEDGIEYAGQ